MMKEYSKKLKYVLLKIKNRLFHGKPVLVLMYHRVSDVVDESNSHLTVSVANFEKQLQFFKKQFQIIRLNESWLNLKKNGLVITFDDGYADNYSNALPLLKKYNIPATFFVCSQNIGSSNEFWWDRVTGVYKQLNEEYYSVPKILKHKSVFSIKDIVQLLKGKTNEEALYWISNWQQENGIVAHNRDEYRSLNLTELKALSQEPLIDIELHSNSHNSYSRLTIEEQVADLKLNISFLSNNCSKSKFNYFALPHGSYNDATYKLIEKLNLKGFLLANNYYSNIQNKRSKKINRILMPSIIDKDLRVYLRKYSFPF